MSVYSSQVKGYLLTLLSVVAFTSFNIITKGLYSSLSVIQTQFLIRVFSTVILIASGIPKGKWEWKKSVSPVFCMLTASILFSYAVYFANPGDCLSIGATLPLWTASVGYLIFKKPFPKTGFLQSLFACIVGCTLLVQPAFIFGSTPTTMSNLIGYGLVISDEVFYASYIYLTEIIPIDATFLAFATSLSRTVFWGIFLLIQPEWVALTVSEWLLVLGCALSLAVGSVSRTSGTQITGGLITAFFVLLETPLIYICQYIFLNLKTNIIQLCGVAITLSAVSYFIFQQHQAKLEDERLKKDFEEEI